MLEAGKIGVSTWVNLVRAKLWCLGQNIAKAWALWGVPDLQRSVCECGNGVKQLKGHVSGLIDACGKRITQMSLMLS